MYFIVDQKLCFNGRRAIATAFAYFNVSHDNDKLPKKTDGKTIATASLLLILASILGDDSSRNCGWQIGGSK